MSALISISERAVGASSVQTVNARELHTFLRVGTEFTHWIKRRIDEFDFTQDTDFVTSFLSIDDGGDGRTQYHLTLDMGKELAMVERNAQGKKARQYFIECERRALAASTFAIPTTLSGALRLAAEQAEEIERQAAQIEAQKPAVEFARAVRNTEDGISIGDMARLLGTGQNRLFRRLRDDHILMPNNRPYQHYLDREYFRVIENVWLDAEQEPHPTFKTLVLGRGQVYLQRKYGAEVAA